MSAETVSSTEIIEVHVPLLNEGTDVCRPTKGRVRGPDTVELLPTPDYDPAIEEWQFQPGSLVRYVLEDRGGRRLRVARQRVG